VRGRNLSPLILAVTVAVAAVGFVLAGGTESADLDAQKRGGAVAIAVGVVGMLVILEHQRRWLRYKRLESERAAAVVAPAAASGGFDAGLAAPEQVLAALSLVPGAAPQMASARSAGWALAETSMKGARAVVLVIALVVAPGLILQSLPVVLVGAAIIAVLGVVLSVRVLRPGGQLAQAYAIGDAMVEPLGLRGVDHPDVIVVPRVPADGVQAQLVGATVYAGERHGRRVQVTVGAGRSEVVVAGGVPEFEVAGRNTRLRVEGSAPGAVEGAIESLRGSSVWTSVRAEGGPDGVVVTRKRDAGRAWPYDLWLAELLADAAASTGR
jgi:hypothetical protein